MSGRGGALVATLALLAGCTGSSPTQPAATGPAGAGAAATAADATGVRRAPAPLVELGELTLSWQGSVIARLHADGRTESVGPNRPDPDATFLPGPTLRADGTITLTKAGFTARLETDGAIFVIGPAKTVPREQRFGSIVGEELRTTGSTLPWDVRLEGDTLVFNGPGGTNQLAGAKSPAARRAVLLMTAAFYMEMAIEPPPPPAGSGGPGL